MAIVDAISPRSPLEEIDLADDDPEVDHVDHTEGSGFVMKNPTAKTTCGFGSSFSAQVGRLSPGGRYEPVA